MITRLAVRLERAGLFFARSAEYLVGYRFRDCQFIQGRMMRMRSVHGGLGNLRAGGFQLIQSSIDRVQTGLDSRQINHRAIGVQ